MPIYIIDVFFLLAANYNIYLYCECNFLSCLHKSVYTNNALRFLNQLKNEKLHNSIEAKVR